MARDALDLVPGIVHKASRTLRAKVAGIVGRAVVKGLVETGLMRVVQFERRAGVGEEAEHFEPYGWTSRALDGAEALLVTVGGAADHRVAVIVADRRHRPTDLDEGEVCVHTDQGAEVRLKQASILVKPPAGGTVDVGGTGGPAAARLGDETTWNADVIAWAGAVQTMLGVFQGLHGGAGVLPTPPAGGYKGTITSGSATVSEVD